MPIITRLGGGGSPLNFKVTAYASLPDSGKENEIAVITETPMTGWVMQNEEPTAAEGLVWLAVGEESDGAFYADKKQFVKIYPKEVKQYVDGGWSNVNAYIYQNSAWAQFSSEWNGALYDAGNTYSDYTGGWGVDGYTGDKVTGGCVLNSDHILVKPSSGWGFTGTANPIDLSGWKTIHATYQMTSWANMVSWGINTEKETYPSTAMVNITSTAQETTSISIEDINSQCYVMFRANDPGQIKVFKVWMTK